MALRYVIDLFDCTLLKGTNDTERLQSAAGLLRRLHHEALALRGRNRALTQDLLRQPAAAAVPSSAGHDPAAGVSEAGGLGPAAAGRGGAEAGGAADVEVRDRSHVVVLCALKPTFPLGERNDAHIGMACDLNLVVFPHEWTHRPGWQQRCVLTEQRWRSGF